MDTHRVQWLQRMGIDVWRLRTVKDLSQQENLVKPSQPIKTTATQSTSLIEQRVERRPHTTATDVVTSVGARNRKRTQKSTSNQRVQIEVCCSLEVGLLLIKENEALDRDFTEDIFRTYRLLKDLDVVDSEVSFFRFNWPTETRSSNVKGADDASLEGATRAFLATVRSFKKRLPDLIVAIGQKAVQLADSGIFDSAQVLVCLDDPNSLTFKNSLWNFLRDAQ